MVTGGTPHWKQSVPGAWVTGVIPDWSKGTVINGGTLDINGLNLGAEQITVAGQGVVVGGVDIGAIVNNGAATNYALRYRYLNADATFGGTDRWDIRNDITGATPAHSPATTTLSPKTGTNMVGLVNLGNTGLGGLVINQGDILVQGTTVIGTPSSLAPIDVYTGGMLGLWGTTSALTNAVTLHGGAIGADLPDAGSITFGCNITLFSGGIVNTYFPNTATDTVTFTGKIGGTGGLTKIGRGTAVFAGPTANDYSGTTTVNAGNLTLNKTAGVNAIPGNLNIGDGANGGNTVVCSRPTRSPIARLSACSDPSTTTPIWI